MKKLNFFLAAFVAVALFSCTKGPEPDPVPPSRVGFYILSEGTFGRGDSKLAYYDVVSDKMTYDYFGTKNNGETLGDTATDLVAYGSKVYIVVNNSNKVIVIDNVTGKKIATIDMGKNAAGNLATPRYAAAAAGKVFVTTWNNGLAVVDTTLLSVSKNIALTEKFSEGIVARDGKLYVANSGIEGEAYGGNGSTISVVSATEERELETITVAKNINRLAFADNGTLYATAWGNWSTVDAQLFKVDVNSKTATLIDGVVASKFAISGNYAYTYHFSYISYEMSVLKVDLTTGESKVFLAKPKDYGLRSIYDVAVDPESGHIFYLDESGAVVLFSSDFDEAAGTGHHMVFKNLGLRVNSVEFRAI